MSRDQHTCPNKAPLECSIEQKQKQNCTGVVHYKPLLAQLLLAIIHQTSSNDRRLLLQTGTETFNTATWVA